MTRRVSVRLFAPQADRLKELAEARGLSRSATLRALVLEATVPEDAPGVPTEDEVLELLGAAARAGSVSAMQELRTHHRERRAARSDANPLAEFDELAERRATR